MCWVSYRGLEIGERLQVVLLGLQYLALVLFVVFVIYRIATGQAPATEHFSWQWFNPFAFADYSGFIEAVLLALFIYWGWDTCLALNEETRDPKRIPGRAAIISTAILLVTYVGVTVAAMAYAGVGEDGLGLGNEANADDVFLRPQGRRDGTDGHRAGDRGAGVGGLLDPDHDPADGPRHLVDGHLPRPCRVGSRPCTRASAHRPSRP